MSDLLRVRLLAGNLVAEPAWRFLDWCLAKGADELTLSWNDAGGDLNTAGQDRAALETLLGPFRQAAAERPVPDPAGADRTVRRTVELFRLTAESLAALQELDPAGPFAWDPGRAAALEDLVLFRGGRLFLAAFGRDAEALLWLSRSEILELELLGLPHRTEGPA